MQKMQTPTVTCKSGQVSGTRVILKDENAKPVFCFRNIPFAKPPVGKLRFMGPQPAEPWDGVLDGSHLGNIPMQDIESPKVEEPYFPQKLSPGEEEDMNEDCLHLTVYTPELAKIASKPVMVWIYGGGFQDGSERLYDGGALAGLHDVVVVIPNYRLNIFGFLSLGKDSICPGNAGLMDQNMALRWVQQNIREFGGDPDNVTIFGESAGGMSVNHHINSPQSRDLFHKAISHSGQSNVEEFFKPNDDTATAALLTLLGIDDNDPNLVLKRLQEIPAKQLKSLNEKILADSNWKIKFLPCIDGKFLTMTPEQSLAEKNFSRVPYMIGCNNSECRGGIAMSFFGMEYLTGISEEQFMESILFQADAEDLDKWKKFYLGQKDKITKKDFSKLYGHVTGDKIFVVPAITTAKVHSEIHDVYVYHACFQLRMFHDEAFGPSEGMKAPWCYCDHGDEVCVMLGLPFTPGELQTGGKFSKQEEILSRKCMVYITNFAKHGDPNIGGQVDVTWPKYEKNRQHIVLDHNIQVGTNLADKEVAHWAEYEQRKMERSN